MLSTQDIFYKCKAGNWNHWPMLEGKVTTQSKHHTFRGQFATYLAQMVEFLSTLQDINAIKDATERENALREFAKKYELNF